MAKRFTDTRKWQDDAWFCGLSNEDKLFYLFLKDNCDHAGIWHVNWRLVQFHILEFSYKPSAFKGRITELTAEKWLLVGFIEEQYGTLNPANRLHASVIELLKKESLGKDLARTLLGPSKDLVRTLLGPSKGLGRTLLGPSKDLLLRRGKKEGGVRGVRYFSVKVSKPLRSKDVRRKDVKKGKVVGKGIPKTPRYDVLFDQELWPGYPRRLGRKDAQRHFHASVHNDTDVAMIRLALDNFKTHMRKEARETDKIPYGSTWFNQWRDWIEYAGAEIKKPAPLPRAPEVLPKEEDLVPQEDVRKLMSTLKGSK